MACRKNSVLEDELKFERKIRTAVVKGIVKYVVLAVLSMAVVYYIANADSINNFLRKPDSFSERKDSFAAAYLQAELDNLYKNDASGMVRLGIRTAEEAAAAYEGNLEIELIMFFAGHTVPETMKEEFREVLKDMFSKAEYVVEQSEEEADGSYMVVITYKKMIVFEPMKKDFMSNIENLKKDATFLTLSEEQQWEKRMEAMLDSMKAAVASPTYEEPAEFTIRVKCANGLYTFDKRDLKPLEAVLFDIDAVQ